MNRSSPRTWGCFHVHRADNESAPVFPTHVGVFLILLRCHLAGCRLPHARGGVSPALAVVADTGMSSPRTWGCFYRVRAIDVAGNVFPTHVGVFPKSSKKSPGCFRLPHARGGVSTCRLHCLFLRWSSPRTWGCFPPAKDEERHPAVFPTHVGVFFRSLSG